MCVSEIGMAVGMYMCTFTVPCKIMFMLVMSVMCMGVRVRHRLVRMRMLVRFGQVQPDAGAHQRRSDPENKARDFTKHQQGNDRADKRCCREIGTSTCRAKMP